MQMTLKMAFVDNPKNDWDGIVATNGTVINAITHCAINCILESSDQCGAGKAKELMDLNEIWNTVNTTNNLKMDLHNNSIGRAIGKKLGIKNACTFKKGGGLKGFRACWDGCKKAAKQKQLHWYWKKGFAPGMNKKGKDFINNFPEMNPINGWDKNDGKAIGIPEIHDGVQQYNS